MSDRSLIRAAQRGSADAVEKLVRTYWPEAHRVALGIVADAAAAEDVAQEAMLSAVKSLGDFDRRRPLRPWLHRIVVNRALDWVRARERRAEVELTPERAEALGNGQMYGAAISTPMLAILRTLEPGDRAIVVLRHVAGFDSEEIGGVMEMPAGTVRSKLSRALARLRRELEAEAPDHA